jgi:hypothetical protein
MEGIDPSQKIEEGSFSFQSKKPQVSCSEIHYVSEIHFLSDIGDPTGYGL